MVEGTAQFSVYLHYLVECTKNYENGLFLTNFRGNPSQKSGRSDQGMSQIIKILLEMCLTSKSHPTANRV